MLNPNTLCHPNKGYSKKSETCKKLIPYPFHISLVVLIIMQRIQVKAINHFLPKIE
jgi:hypothetical protein